MRVIHWNTGQHLAGPIGDAQIAWLAGQAWDIAILLEVTRRGLRRLEAEAEARVWTVRGSLDRKPKRSKNFSVAMLCRPTVVMGGLVDPPTFPGRNGLYEERAHALQVTAGDRTVVVGGFHMPNSQVRRGTDHSYKEDAFEALGGWVNAQRAKSPVIIGFDANRGDWERSSEPPRPKSPITQHFLRHPGEFGLIDGFSLLDPSVLELPPTHWSTRKSGMHPHAGFDRIMSTLPIEQFTVASGVAGPGSSQLSDHAAVIADVLL
jgi:hypothetical protein